jgi:rare lipoprotein A (peptidoglycan hydrolase)
MMKVTNEETNLLLLVKVNDRCSFLQGRIVGLSTKAIIILRGLDADDIADTVEPVSGD